MNIQTQPMNLGLGEGPLWHALRKSWCWFDILDQSLYELEHKRFCITNPTKHDLPFIGTAMAVVDASSVLIATDKAIVLYDLDTRDVRILCSLSLPKNMRTNEGGMGPDGRFWFSSMEKIPSGLNGSVFSINHKLEIEEHITGIGIPNTMVWNLEAKKFYLSDSYQEKTYTFEYLHNNLLLETKETYLDMTERAGTPDGGALDVNGNLWVALWGGHKVACFSPNGELMNEIPLPVPQPSSCCFGGPEGKHLLITSARESMSEDAVEEYPQSGSTFLVEVDVAGIEVPNFKLDAHYVS